MILYDLCSDLTINGRFDRLQNAFPEKVSSGNRVKRVQRIRRSLLEDKNRESYSNRFKNQIDDVRRTIQEHRWMTYSENHATVAVEMTTI